MNLRHTELAHRHPVQAVRNRPAGVRGSSPGQPAAMPRFLQTHPLASGAAADVFRPAVYLVGDPLVPYTYLRRAAPEAWAALDRTARSRSLGAEVQLAPLAAVDEVTVPVPSLVRPGIPPLFLADLRSRLWPILAEPFGDPDAAAEILQEEMIARWAMENLDLVDGDVRIRLIPPEDVAAEPLDVEALTAGWLRQLAPPRVLAFHIDSVPVDSRDGSIPLLELDLLGSNTLETIAQQVASEALVIATAADLLITGQRVIEEESAFWAGVRGNPAEYSLETVQQHFSLFSISPQQGGPWKVPIGLRVSFFLQDYPEYRSELSGVSERLGELGSWVMEDYLAYLDYHEFTAGELRTSREGLESHWETVERLGSQDQRAAAALGRVIGWGGEAIHFLGDAATFGYLTTRHEAVQAFRRGEISESQLERLSAAAAARGGAVGLVSLALTAATVGLAGPALGTAATVGRKVLFYGGSSAVGGIAAETTGAVITAQHEFRDPAVQRIWALGERTPGQIAIAGAAGFGIGAAPVPASMALGKLVLWLRRAPAVPVPVTAVAPAPRAGLAPSAAEATGAISRLTAPPGWRVEQVGDVLRYTRPDLPGEVIVTGGRLRYQTPAGTGMRVEFDMPLEPRGAVPALPGRTPAPAAGAATAARTLPPAGGGADIVAVNTRSGIFHPPGSRYYDQPLTRDYWRYMPASEARAAGYRLAGTRPPSGVLSVELPLLGERRIVIRSRLGPPQGRRGYERQMHSAAEYGMEELASFQRGHSQGAGLGAEAAEGIRLVPAKVNQELQNRGVERTLRDLYATKAPNEELILTTVTQTHTRTLRLKEIQYVLELYRDGARVGTVFEAAIEVPRKIGVQPRITAEPYGALAE